MPGIIWEMRIASRAQLIQRKRNWASAYAAGVAISSVNTTVPTAIVRLVTRLRPWSWIAVQARVDGKERRCQRASGRLEGDVEHPVHRKQHDRQQEDGDGRTDPAASSAPTNRPILSWRRVFGHGGLLLLVDLAPGG